jgi:putative transcriptional regulator
MNKENITKKATKQDWRPFNGMTAEERHAAALRDPDAQPLTSERLKHMKRIPQVCGIRRALRLSQEEFAARFHIPLGTLRDWEQGRKEPDAAARAYLKVIARNAAAVAKALLPTADRR